MRPAILLACLICVSSAAVGQEVPQFGRLSSAPQFGTLNGGYGNKNGIVVVSDSQLSTLDQNHQPVPIDVRGRKLLQLDDRTVVAVAGLEFTPVDSMDSLSADILGVIAAGYRGGIKDETGFAAVHGELLNCAKNHGFFRV